MAKKIIKAEMPEPQLLRSAEVLGEFIRAARTGSSLTVHDAAALCNVSVSTITNLENAKADVKFSTVLQVCRMLGVTLRIEA
ncbi:helix-turn-helix domain-containing protein [Geovibrio thiophilus]|uniref:Helix-turn-helix domain-containing protein n=1 Tax=Geovibrio thiophilus TaxID=139438 RepID=A0A410JWX9_9BACT|nr:helix-turn-helix domain-containing protein [Geovibrio thiophilus]QAR32702.1 helix-turn-helix domain-containing protein [Geovibrio thiophilus]